MNRSQIEEFIADYTCRQKIAELIFEVRITEEVIIIALLNGIVHMFIFEKDNWYIRIPIVK